MGVALMLMVFGVLFVVGALQQWGDKTWRVKFVVPLLIGFALFAAGIVAGGEAFPLR